MFWLWMVFTTPAAMVLAGAFLKALGLGAWLAGVVKIALGGLPFLMFFKLANKVTGGPKPTLVGRRALGRYGLWSAGLAGVLSLAWRFGASDPFSPHGAVPGGLQLLWGLSTLGLGTGAAAWLEGLRPSRR